MYNVDVYQPVHAMILCSIVANKLHVPMVRFYGNICASELWVAPLCCWYLRAVVWWLQVNSGRRFLQVLICVLSIGERLPMNTTESRVAV